jgi:hypothetical protein
VFGGVCGVNGGGGLGDAAAVAELIAFSSRLVNIRAWCIDMFGFVVDGGGTGVDVDGGGTGVDVNTDPAAVDADSAAVGGGGAGLDGLDGLDGINSDSADDCCCFTFCAACSAIFLESDEAGYDGCGGIGVEVEVVVDVGVLLGSKFLISESFDMI